MELEIPYVITGPDGTRAVFNDPSDPDFIGYLTDISGLDSSDVRESASDLPGQDGGVHGDFYAGRRVVVMNGFVWPGEAGETNRRVRALRLATQALREDCELTWQETGEPEKVLWMRRQARLAIKPGRPRQFQLQLVSAAAQILSADQLIARDSGLSPFVTCPNIGEYEAPASIRLVGPMTNPTISLAGDAAVIVFDDLALAEGDYADIDLGEHTVTVNGIDNGYDALDRPASSWFLLQPGLNEISVDATDTTTESEIIVTWRHAWA